MKFLSQRDNKIDPVNSCLFTSLINQCIANDFKNFPIDPTYSRPSDSLRSFADRNDLDYWVHSDAKEAFNEWMCNTSLRDNFYTNVDIEELKVLLKQQAVSISGDFSYKNRMLGHIVTLLSFKDNVWEIIDPWGQYVKSKKDWRPDNKISYYTDKTFREIFYDLKDGWVHKISEDKL